MVANGYGNFGNISAEDLYPQIPNIITPLNQVEVEGTISIVSDSEAEDEAEDDTIIYGGMVFEYQNSVLAGAESAGVSLDVYTHTIGNTTFYLGRTNDRANPSIYVGESQLEMVSYALLPSNTLPPQPIYIGTDETQFFMWRHDEEYGYYYISVLDCSPNGRVWYAGYSRGRHRVAIEANTYDALLEKIVRMRNQFFNRER